MASSTDRVHITFHGSRAGYERLVALGKEELSKALGYKVVDISPFEDEEDKHD